MIAVRRDSRCRTDVEAAGAAGLAIAGMGANLGFVLDVAWLLEFADHVGKVEERTLHRSRIGRIRVEITVALLRRREERRAAGQVEDEVALRSGAVARCREGERLPRRDDQRRIVVHDDLEGAEVRSEEHTSELQSLMRISYAVFCLKKKNKN